METNSIITPPIRTTVPIVLSPVEQATKVLENRQKRVDVIDKIQTTKSNKVKFQQEENERELRCEGLVLDNDKKRTNLRSSAYGDIQDLLSIVRCIIIDDSKTHIPGSETPIKSLWNEDELATIKSKLLEKVKKM